MAYLVDGALLVFCVSNLRCTKHKTSVACNGRYDEALSVAF